MRLHVLSFEENCPRGSLIVATKPRSWSESLASGQKPNKVIGSRLLRLRICQPSEETQPGIIPFFRILLPKRPAAFQDLMPGLQQVSSDIAHDLLYAGGRRRDRQCRRDPGEPRAIVTDELRSCGVAQPQLRPDVEHRQSRYLDNRAGSSHRPTRRRARQMQRFKSSQHAQDFLSEVALAARTPIA
jgi:hypothetical protein